MARTLKDSKSKRKDALTSLIAGGLVLRKELDLAITKTLNNTVKGKNFIYFSLAKSEGFYEVRSLKKTKFFYLFEIYDEKHTYGYLVVVPELETYSLVHNPLGVCLFHKDSDLKDDTPTIRYYDKKIRVLVFNKKKYKKDMFISVRWKSNNIEEDAND